MNGSRLTRQQDSRRNLCQLSKPGAAASRIVFDSAVSPTEKVVKGTRLFAEALVAELEQGKDDEEFRKTHPELTAEDLVALRNYARTPIGLRRSFGAWADDAEELDKYLEWNRQQRKVDRREIEE